MLEILDCRDFDIRFQMNDVSVKDFLTSVKLSIETSMEQIKPVARG